MIIWKSKIFSAKLQNAMDIMFLGHASFVLRGKTATVVTDPYDPVMVGFKFPKVRAGIVTVSHAHADHNKVENVDGDPKVVSGPGEYEIGGVSIFGVPTYHDKKQGEERGSNTVYAMNIDGVRVCHLGDLGHKLAEEQVGEIGAVDVLLIPVGGVYTIDAGEASEVVSQLEPRVVIPMHYNTPGLSPKTFSELSGVDEFLKEMGLEPVRDVKYSVAPDKLPEELQVVVLERKL